MTESHVNERNGLWGRFGLGRVLAWRRALLPLALVGAGVWQTAEAQTPLPPTPAPNKHFLTKNTFSLPVLINDRDRGNLQAVQLFWKEPAGKYWVRRMNAPPTQDNFPVTLDRDGEFWFTVVTVDKAGNFTPRDLTNEGPMIIIVQDTTAPQVEVRQMTAASEGIMVRCEVRDANPDPSKTRVEYQTGDKQFRVAEPVVGQPETFLIPAQAVFTGLVKASVTDMANNVTTREVNLGTGAAPLTLPVPVGAVVNPKDVVGEPGLPILPPVPPVPPPATPIQRISAQQIEPLPGTPGTGTAKVQPVEPPGHVVNAPPKTLPETVAGTPAAAAKTAAATITAGGRERKLVSQPRISLEYQVEGMGPSGVGKVEAWITSDDGKFWRRLCEDKDRRSPIELELPGEGVFGIRLAVSNGGGFGGGPPQVGDAPDWVIEVDQTKPSVELTSVRPSMDETNELIVSWKANDKNFGNEAIELLYSVQRDGPWTPIAKGLRNDGRYRWALPRDMGVQAYLRVVATDRVGNSSHAETPQPITLDDHSRPVARPAGVALSPARPTSPGGS